jgi:hypothetical protein
MNMRKLLAILIFFICKYVHASNEGVWKVELIITAPSLNSLESIFGHASLAITPPGMGIESAKVWQFSPDTSGANKDDRWSFMKSHLNEEFPLILEVIPFYQFISLNFLYDHRNLQRYLLPLDNKQVSLLMNQLEDLRNNNTKLKNYDVFKNNCVSVLLDLFEGIGINIEKNKLLIADRFELYPELLPRLLRIHLISFLPPFNFTPMANRLAELTKKYHINFGSIFHNNRYLKWNSFEIEVLRKMTLEELLVVSHSLNYVDNERLPFVRNLISKFGNVDYQAINIENYPDEFYRICKEKNCAKKVALSILKHFGKEEFNRIRKLNFSEYFRSKRIPFKSGDLLQTPQGISWKLIVDEMNLIYRDL